MRDRKIILASGSPRRRELLEGLGLEFKVIVPKADEESISKDIPPDLYVLELAVLKAAKAVGEVRKSFKHAVVIAADTVVCSDGEIMGKPDSEEEAFTMLKALSGREHEVYTGICVSDADTGETYGKKVRTVVRFKELTDEKIRAYIATGEPMDKAGAYGIQGLGSMLVDGIEGDYFNVVGLPVSVLADILEKNLGMDILKMKK